MPSETKWTQQQTETAIWDAGRLAKNMADGAVGASIEMACQRNALRDALQALVKRCQIYGGSNGGKMDLEQAKEALRKIGA